MGEQRRIGCDSHTRSTEAGPDRVIAAVAQAQHGVLGRPQLVALGLETWEIAYRVRVGRLHVVHSGVYAVGHALLTRHGRVMAAVLAAGPAAVVSHRSAAWLHGVRDDGRFAVEVTVPRVVRRPGIEAYRSAVPDDERDVIDGIPVTSLHRTLLDLAAVAHERQVERAMEQALRLRLGDRVPLAGVLDRYPNRKGVACVRRILARGRLGRTFTRSGLEERFLGYCARHGLPPAECNAHADDREGKLWECDALWRRERIVVELDSREWHDNDRAFGTDREKNRRLTAAGWRFVPVASEHLLSAALAADLRSLLSG